MTHQIEENRRREAALHVDDAAAGQKRRQERRHNAVDVRQRETAHRDIGRVDAVRRDDVLDAGRDVRRRQHHALAAAGGTGGQDTEPRRPLVFIERLSLRRIDDPLLSVAHDDARRENLQQFRVGVIARGALQRNGHAAGRHSGEEMHDRLCAEWQLDDDAHARPDAAGLKTRRAGGHALRQLAIVKLAALAAEDAEELRGIGRLERAEQARAEGVNGNIVHYGHCAPALNRSSTSRNRT